MYPTPRRRLCSCLRNTTAARSPSVLQRIHRHHPDNVDGRQEYDWVAEYENYIKDLKQHKANVEAAIRSDYKDGGDVKEYVDFHLEELDASIIDKVLVGTDASKSKEERLLTALKLKRIGFYPGNENYAVWDYTIGREITDLLVVVNTDSTGKINYVTWEN